MRGGGDLGPCLPPLHYDGTGKMLMWKTFTFVLQSQWQIVLIVVSSGIASLLLFGDTITHSKFNIHVSTLDNLICNIHQWSELTKLLKINKVDNIG